MDTSLREDGHLARRQGTRDDLGAVLLDHVGGRVTLDGDDEVIGARVEVRREHGAGAQGEPGDGQAVAGGRREGGGVGVHDAARGVGVFLGLCEVELVGVTHEVELGELCGRGLDQTVEGGVDGLVDGEDGGCYRKGGEEDGGEGRHYNVWGVVMGGDGSVKSMRWRDATG